MNREKFLSQGGEKVNLIRILMEKPGKQGSENNLQIEPNGPVFDVIKVEFDPFLHFVQSIRFTTPAMHLCPTGNAGLYFVAEHVIIDLILEMIVVLDCVGARPDDGHPSLHYIDDLR